MRGTGATAAILVCTLTGACIALSGCAKPGPPPGGPVDEEPPWVVATEPENGSVLVPVSTSPAVLFSEEMDRTSVERSLVMSPHAALRSAKWRGPRMEMRFAGELSDSTTYVVTLGDGARDDHGVSMEGVFTFAFSTGETLDDCGIAGTVLADGEPAEGATVWACPGIPAPDSLAMIHVCGRATETGPDGEYRLGHLSHTRSPYSLVAFLDADRDGAYSLTDETGAMEAGVVRFVTAADTVRGIALTLEPPGEGVGGATDGASPGDGEAADTTRFLRQPEGQE